MLKKRLFSFCIGGLATKASVELLTSQIPYKVDGLTVLVVTIVALTLFYQISEIFLLRWKVFRYLVSFKMTRREGLWATELNHPVYKISLAEIKYDHQYDKYTYSGFAFIDDKADASDGAWKSNVFTYDEKEEGFLFTCAGHRNLPNHEKGALIVDSYGTLTPNSYNVMTGIAVDLDRDSKGNNQPISFEMRLFRVSNKTIRNVLGELRSPETGVERIVLIRTTLNDKAKKLTKR